jgi:hypothetical protein
MTAALPRSAIARPAKNSSASRLMVMSLWCTAETGLPASMASRNASSSACTSMRRAIRFNAPARSLGFAFPQGPSSTAARAALTAASTSAAPASAIWATTRSSRGLTAGNVAPAADGVILPPIRSPYGSVSMADQRGSSVDTAGASMALRLHASSEDRRVKEQGVAGPVTAGDALRRTETGASWSAARPRS